MILKVQLSLASTNDVRQVLIYNEDRSFEHQGPLSNFNGLIDEPKVFYETDIIEHEALKLTWRRPGGLGEVPARIEIVFGKRLPDQGW